MVRNVSGGLSLSGGEVWFHEEDRGVKEEE